MVVRQAFAATRAALRAAGIEEDAPEADLLLRLATGRGHLEQDAERELTGQEIKKLDELTRRRCTRYPAQYLAGSWPFYGLELAVGEGVLIPRPDTETVVEQALKLLKGCPAPRVLDLCAGSGAIGLAIRQMRPDAAVTLVERSEKALVYCRENAGRNAKVVQADFFGYENAVCPGSVDCLVCNPPYVTEQEYAALAPELSFEPKEALVAPQQGLAFYRYLARSYRRVMAPGGALALEIGAAQRAAVMELLASWGWRQIGCEKDLGGNDRCVFARAPQKGEEYHRFCGDVS